MAKFAPGQTLQSPKGNTYRIIRYLGEGVTAQIYLSERIVVTEVDARFPMGSHVALKVLHDNLPEDIILSFRHEADTLRELINFENRAGQEIVPRLVEVVTGSKEQQEFLAMEFVHGQPLDKWVDENGPLPEQDALLIAEKVLSVLDILHTNIRKSYTDFQLQNVWWQPETRQIKLMDWNHVSRRVREDEILVGAVDDLTRLGAYLYQIVTGKGALQTGETTHALARRAGSRWDEEISAGTRAIISQSLHPNPARRFASAAVFRDHVTKQQDLWQMTVDELDEEVLAAMRPIRSSQSKGETVTSDQLQEAIVVVDMLRRQRPSLETENNYEQLQELTDGVSAAWGSGRQYYKMEPSIFSRVVEIWQAEAEALGRVDLWRWVMVAQLGERVGSATYKQAIQQNLETAMQEMNQEHWDSALTWLQAIPKTYQSEEAWQGLYHEVAAHIANHQARKAVNDKQWNAAAVAYGQVLEELKDIPQPYGALVREAYFESPNQPELKKRVEECEENARLADTSDQQQKNLRHNLKENFAKAVGEISSILQQDPDNPAVWAVCEAEIPQREGQEKIALLSVLLRWGWAGDHTGDLNDRLMRAREEVSLAAAEKALQNNNWPAVHKCLTGVQIPPSAGFVQAVNQRFNDAIRFGWLPEAEEAARALIILDQQNFVTNHQQRLDQLRLDVVAQRENFPDILFQRVTDFQANRQYQEAQDLLDKGKTFYADQPEIVARLEKLKPEIVCLSRAQAYEEDAQSNLAQESPDWHQADWACRKALALLKQVNPSQEWAQQVRDNIEQLQKQVATLKRVETCEIWVTEGEKWLAITPPNYKAAQKSLAEAYKAHQDLAEEDVPEELKARLADLADKSKGDEIENARFWYHFWVNETDKYLNGPMATLQRARVTYDLARGLEPKLENVGFADFHSLRERLDQFAPRLEGKADASGSSSTGQPDKLTGGIMDLAGAMRAIEDQKSIIKTASRRTSWVMGMAGAIVLLLLGGLGYLILGDYQGQQQIAALQTQMDDLGGRLPEGTALAVITPEVVVAEPMLPTYTATPTLTATPTFTSTPTETPTTTGTPTPTPLPPFALRTTLVSSGLSDQESAYYDFPDVSLVAPEGWRFDISGDDVQLVDVAGDIWALNLVYTGTLSAGLNQTKPTALTNRAVITNTTPVTETMPVTTTEGITNITSIDITELLTITEVVRVPVKMITYALGIEPITALTVSWTVVTETAPLLPGSYLSYWQISKENDVRLSDPFEFTVWSPLTVTVGINDSYRTEPRWDRQYNVDGSARMVVEVLGKITITQEGISAFTNPREDAVFLRVRVPGTRQIYWLADEHTQEFIIKEMWTELLDSVPDV